MLTKEEHKLLDDVKYLNRKYYLGLVPCRSIIQQHPDVDLDSKEMEMYVNHYQYLSHFFDGDRSLEYLSLEHLSLEHFVNKYPIYKDVYEEVKRKAVNT